MDSITDPAPIPDPAPIADRAPIDDDSEKEKEDGGRSDLEPVESFPGLLMDEPEGQLFQDEDEAARQFPKFFEGDEAPTLVYNLDSQEGREGATDLLDLYYEHLVFPTPQRMMSIALYRAEVKDSITRDGHNDYCRVVSELT